MRIRQSAEFAGYAWTARQACWSPMWPERWYGEPVGRATRIRPAPDAGRERAQPVVGTGAM